MAPRGAHEGPVVTTDVVAIALLPAGLHVLTLVRGREPFAGCQALPGVYVGRDETIVAAADRCLLVKTGREVPAAAFRRTIGVHDSVGRDPRGHALSVVHVVVWPTGADLDGQGQEITVWQPVRREIGLAFDHDEIVRDAAEWLAGSLWTNGAVLRALVGSLPLSTSTLVQLATAVEGEPPNTSNLRRRVAASGLLVATEEKIVGSGPGRPSTGWAWA